jgi:hypothetical protein
MAINFWRSVGDTDDGCSKTQCLQCYTVWEGRTHGFVFCPYCGVKWQGQHPPEDERNKQTELEYKIYRARDKNRFDIGYYWVIEKRLIWESPEEELADPRWERLAVFDGRYSALEIHKEFKHNRLMEKSSENDWRRKGEGLTPFRIEVRVRITRTRPVPSWEHVRNYFDHGCWVVPEVKKNNKKGVRC